MINEEECLMMPFKKYVQTHLNKLYHDETIEINGTFKETPCGKIVKNDIFTAHKVGRGSIEETYKAYISWFNYTRREGEEEREFVAVSEKEQMEDKMKSFDFMF